MVLIARNAALIPHIRDRKDLIHDDNTSVLGGAHGTHRSVDVPCSESTDPGDPTDFNGNIGVSDLLSLPTNWGRVRSTVANS